MRKVRVRRTVALILRPDDMRLAILPSSRLIMPQAHGLLPDAPVRSIDELLRWCEERGVERSAGLKVKDEDGSWGVFAERDYELGQICE